MADIDFGNNNGAPKGAVTSAALLAQDAILQANHPSWPTGGSAAQLSQETSGYDNSAVSPKGAMGIAQVEPTTLKAIEAQTGKKLDPNNVNDQMFIHRYLMDQNLSRYNGDPSASVAAYNSGTDKSKWDNPETNNYVRNFNATTGINVDSPYMLNQAVQPTTPQQTSPAQNTSQPQIDFGPASSQPASNVDFGSKPVDNSLWNNIKGLGMQAANLVGGGLEAPVIGVSTGVHAIENLAQGQGLQQALQTATQQGAGEFNAASPENLLNKAGVDTSGLHNTAGYQVPGKAMDYLFQTLPHQLATAGTPESPFSAAQVLNPAQQQAAETGIRFGELASPALEMARPGLGKAGPSEAELAAQKFAAQGAEPSIPPSGPMPWEMGPQPEGGGPLQGQPNAGPQRPAIAMNSQGIGIDPLQPVTAEMMGAEQARNRMGPNEGPQLPEGVDPMAQRVSDFNTAVQTGHEFTQGDLFNDLDQRRFDQYGENETPRTLTRDEFDQTMENLAATKPDEQGRPATGFEIPEDRDAAYDKYLQTVSDEQGKLFDRPTIADNFAKAINESIVAQRVADHPAVKTAQNEVDRLQAQIASTPNLDQRGPLESALAKAKATLAKATDNVTK